MDTPTISTTPVFDATEKYQMWEGDCLKLMRLIPDGSIDAVVTDLPYGTTACKWDFIIDPVLMWEQVKRILKPKGAFVTTACQPFTTTLITSNFDWFKYTLVWDKRFCGAFVMAKYRPMLTHEDIVIFGRGMGTYNPQKTKRDKPIKGGGLTKTDNLKMGGATALHKTYNDKYPISILDYPRGLGRSVHSTQKPIVLYEYLIRTYTNPDELVLDLCFGSGTTAIACYNTGRRFVGMEKEPKYFDIAIKRLQTAQQQLRFDDLIVATAEQPEASNLFDWIGVENGH